MDFELVDAPVEPVIPSQTPPAAPVNPGQTTLGDGIVDLTSGDDDP